MKTHYQSHQKLLKRFSRKQKSSTRVCWKPVYQKLQLLEKFSHSLTSSSLKWKIFLNRKGKKITQQVIFLVSDFCNNWRKSISILKKKRNLFLHRHSLRGGIILQMISGIGVEMISFQNGMFLLNVWSDFQAIGAL